MVLLGLFLVVAGFALNVSTLRRRRATSMSPAETLRSPAWILSSVLIVAGVLLLVLAR